MNKGGKMDFVALENTGKKIFEQFPFIKRSCKRIYQLSMYVISKEKFKVDGEVIRVYQRMNMSISMGIMISHHGT